MAKRKRLTPARLDKAASEAKTMFPLGVARHALPIADVARESAASAALEEMTQNWTQARAQGRLVMALPHDAIDLEYLQRDRVAVDADDMTSLELSLSERGQQTPIEVVALPGDAGYGLLSGWRRCQGLRALYARTGDPQFATVQAVLRQPQDAPDAYRTMVEENEIRANLSHYERARIVVKAVEGGVFAEEEAGLSALFGSVPRARRSKIRSFLVLVHALDGVLRFPNRISERMGLDLVQRLQADAGLAARLRKALTRANARDADAEQAVIKDVLAPKKQALKINIEPDTASKSEVLARMEGLRVLRTSSGALVVSGEGVTKALAEDLIDWLAAR